MKKGTHVFVKPVCSVISCSYHSCKTCQQMHELQSLQSSPDPDDICNRHRGKKQISGKSQPNKKDSSRFQPTKCECQHCTCEMCKFSKRVNQKKTPFNLPSYSASDPDDICERHRGRKKQTTDLFVTKKPTYKLSKSLPPSPSPSKPGSKLPNLKQLCDCKECSCDRCSFLYDRPLSFHALADPASITGFTYKSKPKKRNFHPICDCKECHCPKCNAFKPQITLQSFTEKEERNKKTDDCQVCLQIREQEKKSSVCKNPSRDICSPSCVKKPKEAKVQVMPPCDCKLCKCTSCKKLRQTAVKYTSTATETDEICDRHRGWGKKKPGECRLCKEIQEKQDKKPSFLNILNSNRLCNCEVVANALGSMKYDMASMHPLNF